MRFDECTPGLIVATPRGELLEVKHVKYNRMRAKLLFPLQKTTVYREYGEDMVRLMTLPKNSLLEKYEEALGKRRRRKA